MASTTSIDLEGGQRSRSLTTSMESLLLGADDGDDEVAELEYSNFVKTLVRSMRTKSIPNKMITAVLNLSIETMKNEGQQTTLIESYMKKREYYII
jgi:hypothetical protein